MKKLKIFYILTLVAMFFAMFSVVSFADDTTPEPAFTFNINYTPDSVLKTGVTVEAYTDPETLKPGFSIVKDLPVGYVLFDTSDTAHIEGIRVNDTIVQSLNVPYTEGVYDYTIDVKIVYAEGILGDIAQMSDGTYDWSKLLENPIILLQGAYFILAIISVLICIVSALIGKNKKVKTADEIAAKVEESSNTAVLKVEERVTAAVIAEVMPIVQSIYSGMQNVIKAVTLSTSKSKEAPLALLETLKDSANISTSELIDKIQAVVKQELESSEKVHEERVNALHAIAVPKVAVEPVEPVETVEKPTAPVSETKAIF